MEKYNSFNERRMGEADQEKGMLSPKEVFEQIKKEQKSQQKAPNDFETVKDPTYEYTTELTPADFEKIRNLRKWRPAELELISLFENNKDKPIDLVEFKQRKSCDVINNYLNSNKSDYKIQKLKPIGVDNHGMNFSRIVRRI